MTLVHTEKQPHKEEKIDRLGKNGDSRNRQDLG